MAVRILVCEDDIIVAKVIQIALESEQVQAYWVKDGDKAFRLLKENNDYDLIITDIHMPHHKGDEILDLVRVQQKKNTPIIMISSDDAEEAIALALKSGVNEYIVKPIDPIMLNKKVKKLLKL
jgi:DNA-binding response OmpR family regulator